MSIADRDRVRGPARRRPERPDPGDSAGERVLSAWKSIPRRLERSVSGLSPRELSARGGSENRSIREYAHHVVEANLVVSTIVIAAVGRPGCVYDWSWLVPDASWFGRLGYDTLPAGPAIALLRALCDHVVGLARNVPGSLSRPVRLAGASGAPRRTTLRRLLEDECEHARRHLRDIRAARNTISRRRRPRSG